MENNEKSENKETLENEKTFEPDANLRMIEPIAKIYTDYKEKFGIPRQSGLAKHTYGKIVFEEKYRDIQGIKGIEEFEYLWLLWDFSLARKRKEGFGKEDNSAEKRPSLTVHPPRLGGTETRGVFATRSPFRPNNIGLSSVKLEKVKLDENLGPVLIVSGADILDGTDIYDIKPYVTYSDAHPEAKSGFADLHKDDNISVEWDEKVMDKIPESKREGLLEILRQDPRAAYNKKPDYIYGMHYSDFDVRFTADDNVIKIVDIIKVNGDKNFEKVKQ